MFAKRHVCAVMLLTPGAGQGEGKGSLQQPLEVRIELQLRPLLPEDYDKRFLALLSELTDAPSIPRDFFRKRLDLLLADPLQTHIVAEDIRTKTLCATATLVVENKFIHGCGRVGHLEDVVVRSGLRGHGIGRNVVQLIVTEALRSGCYKVLVDCEQHNVPFYLKCGFQIKDAQMAAYFKDGSKGNDTLNEGAGNMTLVCAERAIQDVCSAARLAGSLSMRQLVESDFKAGFLDLLSQLTVVGDITEDSFTDRLREMEMRKREHVVVVEDTSRGQLVACGTLVVEHKFIHSNGAVGHVEDVVVDSACRGLGVGRELILALKQMAKRAGCYKCILNCSEDNVPFYEKCGMHRKCVSMAKYL